MKINPLIISILGISVAGITFGLIGPVTVILLEQAKTPGIITGLVTTLGYISIVFFSSYTGKLIDRYNVKKVLSAGLVTVALSSLGLIFWRNLYILFPIRLLLGIGVTFVFVATEVMINTYSNENNRGKNIGLYVVALSAGIAIGTLMIWTVHIKEWLSFVLGSAIIFVVFIFESMLLNDLKEVNPKDREEENFPLSMMPLLALFSSAIYGIFEASITVAIPLFGLRSGYSDTEISYFLASYVTGGIILLYLISYLSDRTSRFLMLLILSVLLGILFIFPALLGGIFALVLIFFLIGGIVPAFYTIGLTYTMERIDKKFIARANGHYAMLYGAGTLAGPLFASMLIELNRQYAYWLFSALLCFGFFFYFSFVKKPDRNGL